MSDNTPRRRSSKGKTRPVNRTERTAVRPDSTRAQRAAAAKKAEQRKRTSLIGGAIGIILIAALIFLAFNVLGDDDESDTPGAVPTSVDNANPVASPTGTPEASNQDQFFDVLATDGSGIQITIPGWAAA